MRLHARRPGFSLTEIMVALVILTVIIVGLALTTTTFLHDTTVDTVRVQASTIADSRIAEVRGWPDYSALVGNYNESKANYPMALDEDERRQFVTVTFSVGNTGPQLSVE